MCDSEAMTTVRPRLFDRTLLAVVVALVAAVSTIIGAVALSGQSHASGWEEEITAGLTPGVPTIAMPEMPGSGVWNVVAADGTVTAGIACQQSQCGRSGPWNGIYPPDGSVMIWNPVGAASGGRYFTNGLYVWGGGYVLPGTTTVINPNSPTTAPPPVVTTTTAPLATDGSVYGVESYIINSNGVRCHLTVEGYWDFYRSCVDSSRVQFALCFQATASRVSFNSGLLAMTIQSGGQVHGATQWPSAGVRAVEGPSCGNGYMHTWSFDHAEPGTTYQVNVTGERNGQGFASTWSFSTPERPVVAAPSPAPGGGATESAATSPTTSATTTTTTVVPTTTTTTTVATTSATTSATPTTTTVLPGPTTPTATPTLTTTTLTTTTMANETMTTVPGDSATVTLSAAAVPDRDDTDPTRSASEIAATERTLVVIPSAPAAAPGEGAVQFGGVASRTTSNIEDGALVMRVGAVSATVVGLDVEGAVVQFTEARLDTSHVRSMRLEIRGITGLEQVEVWMMSTPRRLGALKMTPEGVLAGEVPVVAGIEAGAHRLVVSGAGVTGESMEMALGMQVNVASEGALQVDVQRLAFIVLLGLLAAVLLWVLPGRVRWLRVSR